MRAGRADWTSLPIHPLLAAAYPVAFLFATNAAEQVTLDPLWTPLLLAVGGAAALLAVLWLLLRDPWRAALLATVLIVGFFGYGHAWNLTGGLVPRGVLLAGWLILVGLAAVLAWRAGSRPVRATRVLNVLSALLVATSVVAIAAPFLGPRIALDFTAERLPMSPGVEDPDELPDVYYLVFDRYARGDVLAELYGHDNEPFLSELEERGFYVADESHSNYSKTPLSLVSSLNMEYLDVEALRAEAAADDDREPIHRRLRAGLRVPAALKDLGYTYHHIANWWEPSAANVDADHVYRDAGPTEFTTALLQTTIFSAVWQAETIDPFDWRVYRSHHEYEFEVLREIGDLPGPKYVFAHVLLPHEPYVFDSDGTAMTEEEVAGMSEREAYRRQLEFLNDQILEVVDEILASSERSPIMLIQADEGPFPPRYRLNTLGFDWRQATPSELEEKSGILNTYRLPGVSPEEAGLYPSITPVNSFRVVFNAYFGTDLPLLPDRVYAHVSQNEFFDIFEITDQLRR